MNNHCSPVTGHMSPSSRTTDLALTSSSSNSSNAQTPEALRSAITSPAIKQAVEKILKDASAKNSGEYGNYTQSPPINVKRKHSGSGRGHHPSNAMHALSTSEESTCMVQNSVDNSGENYFLDNSSDLNKSSESTPISSYHAESSFSEEHMKRRSSIFKMDESSITSNDLFAAEVAKISHIASAYIANSSNSLSPTKKILFMEEMAYSYKKLTELFEKQQPAENMTTRFKKKFPSQSSTSSSPDMEKQLSKSRGIFLFEEVYKAISSNLIDFTKPYSLDDLRKFLEEYGPFEEEPLSQSYESSPSSNRKLVSDPSSLSNSYNLKDSSTSSNAVSEEEISYDFDQHISSRKKSSKLKLKKIPASSGDPSFLTKIDMSSAPITPKIPNAPLTAPERPLTILELRVYYAKLQEKLSTLIDKEAEHSINLSSDLGRALDEQIILISETNLHKPQEKENFYLNAVNFVQTKLADYLKDLKDHINALSLKKYNFNYDTFIEAATAQLNEGATNQASKPKKNVKEKSKITKEESKIAKEKSKKIVATIKSFLKHNLLDLDRKKNNPFFRSDEKDKKKSKFSIHEEYKSFLNRIKEALSLPINEGIYDKILSYNEDELTSFLSVHDLSNPLRNFLRIFENNILDDIEEKINSSYKQETGGRYKLKSYNPDRVTFSLSKTSDHAIEVSMQRFACFIEEKFQISLVWNCELNLDRNLMVDKMNIEIRNFHGEGHSMSNFDKDFFNLLKIIVSMGLKVQKRQME